MINKLFNNTRKPEGFLGKIMIKMMNIGHSKMAQWGVSHIKLSKTDYVLDVGCGGGKNIENFLKTCDKVDGIDYSCECVIKSKQLNKDAIDEGRCRILEASVENLPFTANTFDVVSAFETIYFWPNIQNVFKSINDILKPGGKFIIVNEACDERGAKWEKTISGMKVYREHEILELLKNANFEISLVETQKKSGWIVVVATKQI